MGFVLLVRTEIHTAEPLVPVLSAFDVEILIGKLKSPHVSVPGDLHTTVLGNPHTSQCSGQSPHRSMFLTVSTSVTILDNLHIGQCS